jgi:FMN reductase
MSLVRIVGLGGSLAEYSTSLSALNVALEGARDYGADVRLFDLRELNLCRSCCRSRSRGKCSRMVD